MISPRREDEIRLAKYLIKRTVDQLTGRSEDICIDDRPRNRYFIGSLANKQITDDKDAPGDDYLSRLAPSASGLDILLKPEAPDARIVIGIKFNVYYRIYPDLKHQQRISGYETTVYEEKGEEKSSEWALAWKKIPVQTPPIEIRLPHKIHGRVRLDNAETQAVIDAAILSATQKVRADPFRFREPHDPKPILKTALVSEDVFTTYIYQSAESGKDVIPQWQVQLQVQARPTEKGHLRISIMLQNVSPDDQIERSTTDHYLFDVYMCVEGLNATIYPFIFDILPEDYRYNRELWGLGHNCSVRVKGKNLVETENSPVYYQPVYITRDIVDPSLPKATFQSLADNPITVLRAIADAMDDYQKKWEQQITKRQSDKAWTSEMLLAAQADLHNYIEEVNRFRRGISSLEKYEVLLHAFKLMNQTFANAGKHNSWRLFQIVYIVCQLPAIAAREFDDPDGRNDWDWVDVLWFPTGGGKTEAYLGLIVCTAFFDRLRGKKAGVSAWMRFPLRLLSLQQMQRLADIMGAAESLRRNTPIINEEGYDPFSVAYLVGSGNTPNKLTEYSGSGKISWLERFQHNPILLQRFLTIPQCPFCGQKSVKMDLEANTIRLIHRCTNPDCSEATRDGILPIFIVDNEIYRYLPTVIAGTIDKVTAIGYERKFSHLFGNIQQRCPKHGYLSMGECTEKYAPCDIKPKDYISVVIKDPSPTLIIQDELHLLREELGAFDGHYETFIDTFQQRNHRVRAKIIAATATIEEYENQVSHLYDRKARRFPSAGPELGESFYATTLHDDVRRIYVGIMPHNYTHINAVIRLAELFHREIETMWKDPQKAIKNLGLSSISTTDEFLSILHNYNIFITYIISKLEGDRLNQSFEGQLNRELSENGFSEVINKSITGETPFSEVAQILEELEKPTQDFSNELRSITATSTISHGVDMERLNYLCFFGMPRQTAEYIQTSSRVGRNHPGIVLVCFNPTRERDQSHYHFFTKYHEYLDRLVEPVPINRWSKFSIKRTIPGLFMAIILNDLNPRIGGNGKESLYFSRKVRQLIESRQIQLGFLIDYLIETYRTAGHDAGWEFEKYIQDKVNEYIDLLRNPIQDFTSNNLTDQPMQSLRDIDEQIEIRLSFDSANLLKKQTKR